MDGELILALVDSRSRRVVHEFPHVGVEELESGRFIQFDRVGSGAATSARRWPGSRVHLGGVSVDLLSSDEFTTTVISALEARPCTPLLVGSVNLDHIHHFGPGADPEARRIGLADNWLMTLDGAPIAWAAQRVTREPQERICGSDSLPVLLAAAESSGFSVGFLGGTAEAQAGLDRSLAADYPGLKVTGHWTPERAVVISQEASRALAAEIAASGTDMLVVGLGKPLQELWLQRHASELGISVGLAYGASADFLAGVVTRAPQALRDHGLEWAYRLSQEPRRLSRRYLIQGPRAMSLLMKRGTRERAPARDPGPRLIVLPDTDHAARLRHGLEDETTAAVLTDG